MRFILFLIIVFGQRCFAQTSLAQNDNSQIEILDKESSLSIYPNPTNGTEVNLVYLGTESIKNVAIEIYNLSGILIANYPMKQETNFITFPTNKLKSGVYFVKVFSDNNLLETTKINY